MKNELNKAGLFWHPLGGNNIDQISGHCYHYFDMQKTENGNLEKTSIIIDIGKFDNHEALGVANSLAAIPDIRNLLEDNHDKAEAIFLTHAHPDHTNGIVHYLKAGYKLPPIYAGKYTFMILEELFEFFKIPRGNWPKFNIIDDGDITKIGSISVEAISSSHTCFDSLGFIIKTKNATIYHTGDMKIDDSTYLRKPTNIKRLKELFGKVDCVVADFCQAYKAGYPPKEQDTFEKIRKTINRCNKNKIFIPVYPTHPEMYIIAFLAALKCKKNVIFYGSEDFYSYLNLIIKYGISFDDLAKDKIKVLYKIDDKIHSLNDNYVVIGTYNTLHKDFETSKKDCFAIVTAKNFFDPIKRELKQKDISFIDMSTAAELQGYGHGFLEDYKYINKILNKPTFIPSHCPAFIIDNFRNLAKMIGMKIIDETPKNNCIYEIGKGKYHCTCYMDAKWLVVSYKNDKVQFTETPQIPTAGRGNIRSTISKRRSLIHINVILNEIKEKVKQYELET